MSGQDRGDDRASGRAFVPAASSQQSVSPVPASIPDAVLDQVAFAIEQARCPGREGPYGGYDYGYNEAFYGPAPEGGRYVVRDFRNPRLPTWGKWVHQTPDRDEHEQAYLRLTGRHIAQAAIEAFAQAMETPPNTDTAPRKDATNQDTAHDQ